MNHKSLRLVAVAGALMLSACIAVDANAQCCGAGGWGGGGYTSYYGGYSSNYAPSYTSYYGGGWYPGYWWDRVSARLWGSPTTYVAGYSPSYYANYGYATSYAPGCSSCGGGCSTCAGYSPCSSCSSCSSGCSSCSSYSPCSSCSSCSADYAPCSSCSTGYVTSYAPSCGCSTCGSSCPSNCGCSNCASGSAVTQASYNQQPSCNCGSHGAAPPPTYVAPPAAVQQQQQPQPTPATPPNGGESEPRPDYNTERPVGISAPANGVTPGPGAETEQKDPYGVDKTDNGAYFEAPKLFNPRDRTARSTSIAPVRTAVYQQPVSYRQTSAAPRGPVTAEQARQDAIGWTSGTN